ncbi:hypothetical protein KIPB_001791 [Kipferlia bialata]|uniref:TNFR-Cys domain-containing protein n=1 Tax=Kipferlia bialata TaxID=797122 RepID=A0A391NIY9_9EUKA|nr:hypothetical protein KIPB_001791 [Kipferlia bialata]|eukprot:g1791.t1
MCQHYGECMGSCSSHSGYCIETKPEQCACSTCAFDFGAEKCLGGCDYPHYCVLTSNTTCSCASCGWGSTMQDKCVGLCQSGYHCIQEYEHSQCTCGKNECTYDYASDMCVGTCRSGTQCTQTKPGQCTCAQCAYDVGKEKCEGNCPGERCLLVQHGSANVCQCSMGDAPQSMEMYLPTP